MNLWGVVIDKKNQTPSPCLPPQLLSVEVESHKAHKAAVETQLQQMEKEFSAAQEELQRFRQDEGRDKASAKVEEETRNILLELERERGRLAGSMTIERRIRYDTQYAIMAGFYHSGFLYKRAMVFEI